MEDCLCFFLIIKVGQGGLLLNGLEGPNRLYFILIYLKTSVKYKKIDLNKSYHLIYLI